MADPMEPSRHSSVSGEPFGARRYAAEFCLWLAFLLVGFVAGLQVTGTAAHFAGGWLARWHSFAVVAVITLVPPFLLDSWCALSRRFRIVAALVFVSVLLASIAIAVCASDITCDGQA